VFLYVCSTVCVTRDPFDKFEIPFPNMLLSEERKVHSTVQHATFCVRVERSKIHNCLFFAKRNTRRINYDTKMNSYGGRSEQGGVRDGSKVSLLIPFYVILIFEQM